ncbi:hypothetical protein CR513_38894, partial [Mucuna pruriens]
MPSILWAFHCTPQTTTDETPFQLAFRTNVMILVEVGEPSIRQNGFNPDDNSDAIIINLNLAEESKRLLEEDLVCRKTGEVRKKKKDNKFATNWEGLFRVREVLNNDPY